MLLGFFLLCALFFHWEMKGLSDLALDSFDTLLTSPLMKEVFDLDEEEAVAVFGDREESKFL